MSRPVLIDGPIVVMRTAQIRDHAEWSALREISRPFLTPWEPIWPDDDLTPAAFRERIRCYTRDIKDDVAYPLLICRKSDRTLVGGVTLSNVRRGVAQTATLGYWMGSPFAGRGYMRAALAALLPFAYDRLGLRRIEAACLPVNAPSIRVLAGAGFQREGQARQYLCINGVWHDHLLFAHLESDLVRPLRARAPVPAWTGPRPISGAMAGALAKSASSSAVT